MAESYLDILAETIRNNWDQPALTDFYLTEDGKAPDTSRGKHYTYGEMYAEIVRVADFLTQLGLQKGDHIAICGSNSSHWVIAYLAIAKMQGVSVTVMHSLQPDLIAQMVNFSDAKALFVDDDLWEDIRPSFQGWDEGRLSHVIALEAWQILRGTVIETTNYQLPITNQDCQFPQVEPDSLAMICFTSGSSGKPKAVMLSYGNLNNNCYNNTILLKDATIDNDADFIAILPFAHMYGLIDNMLPHIINGKHIYILQLASVRQGLSAILLLRPYGLAITPYLLKMMIREDRTSKCLSLLKYIEIGGAPLSENDETLLIEEKIPYFTGYGLTETAPHITTDHYYNSRKGSVGKIVSGMTCRIDTNGEILAKGENVMLGYYKDPEATARKIDSDGWLHTGDKGHLDEDGYLYVEGRLEQDIIVLPNGENIHPDNIEALINALPEVQESIVLARNGKLIARVVVPSSLPFREESEVGSLRRSVLRAINPQLPLFSQLYDVEITDVPLQRTEKMTIKRYLYS